MKAGYFSCFLSFCFVILSVVLCICMHYAFIIVPSKQNTILMSVSLASHVPSSLPLSLSNLRKGHIHVLARAFKDPATCCHCSFRRLLLAILPQSPAVPDGGGLVSLLQYWYLLLVVFSQGPAMPDGGGELAAAQAAAVVVVGVVVLRALVCVVV